MINPEFKKKVFELDQDQPLKNQVLGAKKVDIERNIQSEERSITIKYYIVAFLWVEIIFLSFVLNSNFVGDYSNFINDSQVNDENLSDESKYDTLLAKSKALLAFTIIVGVITIFEIIAIHKFSKNLVNVASILTAFFYLIRFILGIVFLTESQKDGMFDQKSNLDTVISSRPDYCVEGQPSEIKLCRYVYSFNFFYGQEIFLIIVASLLVVPYIMLCSKFKQVRMLQSQREEAAKQKDKQGVTNTQMGFQDLNETKDFLRQENQSQNTSIIQDNYILQQRNIPLERDDANFYPKQYIQSKQNLPYK